MTALELEVQHFHTPLACQKQENWIRTNWIRRVQKELIRLEGVLPLTTVFFEKWVSVRSSYKIVRGSIFPVSILKYLVRQIWIYKLEDLSLIEFYIFKKGQQGKNKKSTKNYNWVSPEQRKFFCWNKKDFSITL